MIVRRLRGALLRVAFNRAAATLAGSALAIAAAGLWLFDYPWESWATDGAALVAGATGCALIVMGVSGRRADWVDPEG